MTASASAETTPAKLLQAVTSNVHPHIQRLLDPNLTYQQLQDDVVPSLSQSITALLAASEQQQTRHSAARTASRLQALDWAKVHASVTAAVETLRAAVLRKDVEQALTLYLQLEECQTLLTLLGDDAGDADRQRLLAFVGCWKHSSTSQTTSESTSSTTLTLPGALHSTSSESNSSDSYCTDSILRATAIIRDARTLLSSHFLDILKAIEHTAIDSQSDAVGKRADDSSVSDVLCVFDTLSHLMPAETLSSYFSAFVRRRHSLGTQPALVATALDSEMSAVWQTYAASVISAFHQQLQLVTTVLLPLLTAEQLPSFLHATFVLPVVEQCSALLLSHDYSLAAYKFILPHLSHVTSFLSTLSSTFLSLPLPPTSLPLPPPPATLVSTVNTALGALPALLTAGTTAVSSQVVWSDCDALLRVCDDAVAVIAAVSVASHDHHQIQAQVDTLVQVLGEKLLSVLTDKRSQTSAGRDGTEQETEEEEPGLRELLVDLSSIAFALTRWAQYQPTLLSQSTVAHMADAPSEPVPSCTSASFATDLHRLLSHNSILFTVSATHLPNNKLQPISPINRPLTATDPTTTSSTSLATRRAACHATSDQLRALLQSTRRAIEAQLIQSLHTVGQSFDGVGGVQWAKKRDLPASLIPALSAPSACVQHLSFFLSSCHDTLSGVLPAGVVRVEL